MAKAKDVTTEAKPRGRAPHPDAQNGVAPPGKGTTSAIVWAECDRSAKKNDGVPVPKDVIAAVLDKNEGLNPSTIKTQIARWRQFHGLVTQKA